MKKASVWTLSFFLFGGLSTAQTADSISQYSITWRFDTTYQCGQFIGGDWWVVGPVTITSVSPDWDSTRHGTMINPLNTTQQGYDTRVYGFNDTLRVKFPITVNAGSSVISVRSMSACATGGAAECISDAAVLTVLSSAPPNGSFRPSYFGTIKTIYDTTMVNYSLLPKIAQPTKPLPNMNNVMVRPWLDHGPKVAGAKIHPQNNMPPYPRDASVQASRMAVLSMINTPQQHGYANRLIQHGIDVQPISLVNVDAWRAYGGFGNGRKWPILFTGIMLKDSAMKNPPLKISTIPYEYKFAEDGFTYYGKPTATYPNGKPLWGRDCIADGYTYPFYTNHDCRDTSGILEAEQMPNGGGYRICCTSHSWIGAALAAKLMCADSLWNHNAFFDYADRWTIDTASWANSSTAYYRDIYGYGGDGAGLMTFMWSAYRKYGNSPAFVASANDTICVGQNTTLTITGIDTNECIISWNGGGYGVDTFFVVSPTVTSTIIANIKYKNGLGCVSSHPFIVTVNSCAGISNLGKVDISIFPNPTKNEISLSGLTKFTGTTAILSLYNLLGEQVYSQALFPGSTDKLTISLNSLSIKSGIYFIDIHNENNYVRKMVVYSSE